MVAGTRVHGDGGVAVAATDAARVSTVGTPANSSSIREAHLRKVATGSIKPTHAKVTS
jgi:hypothetical protein